jgi:hypothetical protein
MCAPCRFPPSHARLTRFYKRPGYCFCWRGESSRFFPTHPIASPTSSPFLIAIPAFEAVKRLSDAVLYFYCPNRYVIPMSAPSTAAAELGVIALGVLSLSLTLAAIVL